MFNCERSELSLPSLIGLKCETGEIEDCKIGLTAEILPDSCKGILMFSKQNQSCGSKCKLESNKTMMLEEPIRKGWSKWIRLTETLLLNLN